MFQNCAKFALLPSTTGHVNHVLKPQSFNRHVSVSHAFRKFFRLQNLLPAILQSDLDSQLRFRAFFYWELSASWFFCGKEETFIALEIINVCNHNFSKAELFITYIFLVLLESGSSSRHSNLALDNPSQQGVNQSSGSQIQEENDQSSGNQSQDRPASSPKESSVVVNISEDNTDKKPDEPQPQLDDPESSAPPQDLPLAVQVIEYHFN